MALANPEQPELKRFSFFVSRRFEEGRERFRLHMGYFSTLKEAEEWLVAVRDIYPGAWAGEAPGKKLRERAVAAAAAQAQHAAGPPPVAAASKPAVAPPRNVPTLPVAQPAQPNSGNVDLPALNVPTIHAANSNPARPAAACTGLAACTGRARSRAGAEERAGCEASAGGRSTCNVAFTGEGAARRVSSGRRRGAASSEGCSCCTRGRSASCRARTGPFGCSPGLGPNRSSGGCTTANGRCGARRNSACAPGTAQKPPRRQPLRGRRRNPPPEAPLLPWHARARKRRVHYPNSNVREVLKALDETSNDAEITGQTRMMPAPSLAGLDAVQDDNSFTDTQVLKYLETRRADGSEISGVDIETGAISLLKPDDTGTRRALKEAVTDNAPVWFAVQLQWAVQPVELNKVPPLAIFSAYTLYTVEGSRDGRKWYGLRLGFFSDAISAKQVAYYVRSEFTSVAVVPVSPQERTRASDVEKKADMPFPKKARQEPVDEFKLIDSDERAAAPPARPRPAVATKPAAPAKSAPPAARRPEAKANSGRVRARDARSPQTLEETLEILGAGELEMDNGNGESMNESGVRHLRVEVQKNTPFGRLLERLSERVRKP